MSLSASFNNSFNLTANDFSLDWLVSNKNNSLDLSANQTSFNTSFSSSNTSSVDRTFNTSFSSSNTSSVDRTFNTSLSSSDTSSVSSFTNSNNNLSNSLLTTSYLNPNYSSSRVAWWKLDSTLGNILADSAGTNDGIKINSPTSVSGIVDNAFSFDGINDYVKVSDNPALDFGTGDFSVSTWVKTIDRSGIDVILDKRIETSGFIQGYCLYIYHGKLGFQLANGMGWTNYVSNTSISDGRWHQVTVSVDRDLISGGKWYVDGQLVDSFNPTGRVGSLSNSADLTLGRRSDHPTWPGYFNGSLDEVMLFDRSLSASQARELYYDSLNLSLTSNNASANSPLNNSNPQLNNLSNSFLVADFNDASSSLV